MAIKYRPLSRNSLTNETGNSQCDNSVGNPREQG
jgi:hypothetical protein